MVGFRKIAFLHVRVVSLLIGFGFVFEKEILVVFRAIKSEIAVGLLKWKSISLESCRPNQSPQTSACCSLPGCKIMCVLKLGFFLFSPPSCSLEVCKWSLVTWNSWELYLKPLKLKQKNYLSNKVKMCTLRTAEHKGKNGEHGKLWEKWNSAGTLFS